MQSMTAEMVNEVSEAVDVAMRERFGNRVIGDDDLPEIRRVFADAVMQTLQGHNVELSPEQLADVVTSFCADITIAEPGPWSDDAQVIDFAPHRERQIVERGEGGYFANCPDDPAKMLQELGVGDGPFAIGLLMPRQSPGEPEMEGVALTPVEARQLAQLLIEKADECEKGWP